MSQPTFELTKQFEPGVLWHETELHEWFLEVGGTLIQVSHAIHDGRYVSNPIKVLDGNFMKIVRTLKALANLRQQTVYFLMHELMFVFSVDPDPS